MMLNVSIILIIIHTYFYLPKVTYAVSFLNFVGVVPLWVFFYQRS